MAEQVDDPIDTPKEVFAESEKNLWESNPLEALKIKQVERRRLLNWSTRFFLSLSILGIFVFLLWLLFFEDVQDTYRDIVNILVGTFVVVIGKTTDFWFKDKDDAEVKEAEALQKNKDTQPNSTS